MFTSIYDFFLNNVFSSNNWIMSVRYDLGSSQGGLSVTVQEWLCFTCSVISIIFIVVLCCMFVYKIIKLIGGLIR